MYNIIFYEDKDGESEIYDYFQKISTTKQQPEAKIFKKLVHQLKMLTAMGPHLNEPQAKFLKKQKYPLWELRPLPERVFYGSWKKDTFIILSHYTKKSDKTDPRQLAKAIDLLEDWYERNGQ